MGAVSYTHLIVEETGLNTAKVQEVSQIDGKWALVLERKRGKTMEEVMDEDPANLEKYMDQFVSLQLEMHSKQAPMLNKLKDKLNRQISSLTAISATTRYELHTRLDSMPKHVKVCHGDFIPLSLIHIFPPQKRAGRRLYRPPCRPQGPV